MILKRKRQQTLAEVLKPIQRNIDNNAVTSRQTLRASARLLNG